MERCSSARTSDLSSSQINNIPHLDLSFQTKVSGISSLKINTGETLYNNSIIPLLANAKYEIILVTCFWARSHTLNHLSALLLKLSNQVRAGSAESPKLRVRIGFSSRSLSQKLFHTPSSAGFIYPPETWASKLGLPPFEELQGLELEVKSIFYRPFSVLHPKFLIIDRQIAIFPSCNISWEDWLEGCITARGPIVEHLLKFWRETWSNGNNLPLLPASPTPTNLEQRKYPTTLLPSPFHISPRFRPWPLRAPPPPSTPLNTYLLRLFTTAESNIVLITPNLTSPPVLSALLAALARGVHVNIVTNRRMMVLEQLLTAGTVTEVCIRRLIRRYSRLLKSSGTDQAPTDTSRAEEGHFRSYGALAVGYFDPSHKREMDKQAVKCHLKCTIVDDRVVVLGSGNMDRASWYTSQELGVAVEYGKAGVSQIKGAIKEALEARIDVAYGDWNW